MPAKFLKKVEIVISIQKMLFQDAPQTLSFYYALLLFSDGIQIVLIKTLSTWRIKILKFSPSYINV